MKVMGNVVDAFRIPPAPPSEVAEASELFERIATEQAEAVAEFHRPPTSRRDDVNAANVAAAEARVEGTKPPSLTPTKVEARIAKAKEEADQLTEALDIAGTRLV